MSVNNTSPFFNNINIKTSLVVNEENNSKENANVSTPESGLFLSPSTVDARTADITGFFVTSANSLGKLEFTDPDGAFSLNSLSDVDLDTVAEDNILTYDGTNWVNSTDITVESLSATTTVGFYGTTPVAQQTDAVGEAAFAENVGGTAVNDDSTFGGYTIGQVVQALQNYGILA